MLAAPAAPTLVMVTAPMDSPFARPVEVNSDPVKARVSPKVLDVLSAVTVSAAGVQGEQPR
jgi:hypothetical protein